MANRVSQEIVEAAILPTSQRARVSQEIVEVAVSPTSQRARVSQIIVEVAFPSVFVGSDSATVGAAQAISLGAADSGSLDDTVVAGTSAPARTDTLALGEAASIASALTTSDDRTVLDVPGFAWTDTDTGAVDDTTTSIAVGIAKSDTDALAMSETGDAQRTVFDTFSQAEATTIVSGPVASDQATLAEAPGFAKAGSDAATLTAAASAVAGVSNLDLSGSDSASLFQLLDLTAGIASGQLDTVTELGVVTLAVGPSGTDSLAQSDGLALAPGAADAAGFGEAIDLAIRVVEAIGVIETWSKNGFEAIAFREIPAIQSSLAAPELLRLADPMIYADVTRPGDLKGSGVFSINGHTPQPSALTWGVMPEIGTFMSGKPLRQGRPSLIASWPVLTYSQMAIITSLWDPANPVVTITVPDPRTGQVLAYFAVMKRPEFQSRSTFYFLNVSCAFEWLRPTTTRTGHPAGSNYP